MGSGGVLMGSISASSGTRLAAQSQTASGSTCALAVDPQIILRNPILRSNLFPIVTPLKWSRWQDLLSAAGAIHEFSDIPIGLRDGFRIGVSSHITDTFSPPNHKSALDNSDFVDSQIQTELASGRYSEGLSIADFLATYGHFRSSPLGVTFHPNSGKPRLIQDHSFPRNNPIISSINFEIDNDMFKCDWGSFIDCLLHVLDAPPGTQVAVFDVDAAHRRMPVAPEDRLHVCVVWRDKVHMDHCCCFGCTSSSGIFGRAADAIVVIYKHNGVDAIIKWADDFTFWRFPILPSISGPWHYSYDESLIWRIGEDLGWPWSTKPGKCIPFASSFRYLGFDWDLVTKSVALPDSKREKFLSKLAPWVAGAKVAAKECLGVIGSLNHCSVVIFSSRTRLPSLYRFSSRFKKLSPFVKLPIPHNVLEDISWWREVLSNPAACILPIHCHPPRSDLNIFIDASTSWGIGVVIEDQWLAWRLADGWQEDGREIGWAEMVALQLLVLTLIASRAPPATYSVRSDNKGVVGAFDANYSRSPLQNAILRHIFTLLRDHDIWLEMKWVPSADNLADGPSRGIFPPFSSRIDADFSIPHPLRAYVCPAVSAP
jgi:hypothetical protein